MVSRTTSSTLSRDAGGRIDESFAEPMVMAPPSRQAVIAAGEALRERIPADDYSAQAEHFRVAHDWREAHLLPMHRMLIGLSGRARAVSPNAIVAGRIKRLSSIRKKLRRSRINLWDIQDIAGVRAIVPTIEDVVRIVERYEGGDSRHRRAKSDDYIAEPKASGYRSYHLMMRFVGAGDLAPINKRSVEMQVRTRLQHSWATALEAVGLMRGEDLKAGEGSPDWLRFFSLVSGQFAAYERQPPVPGVAEDPAVRLDELRYLDNKLDAIATLESYNAAIARVGAVYGAQGGRFTIRFDRAAQTVTVTPFYAGRMVEGAEGDGQDVVVVEVDRIDALAEAYPNYFADVSDLTRRLRGLLLTPFSTAADAKSHRLSWLRDFMSKRR